VNVRADTAGTVCAGGRRDGAEGDVLQQASGSQRKVVKRPEVGQGVSIDPARGLVVLPGLR